MGVAAVAALALVAAGCSGDDGPEGPEPAARGPIDRCDWAMWGYDADRTFSYPCDTRISPATAKDLKRIWFFNADDTVTARPLEVPRTVLEALRERFQLFFTGGTRSASDILADQVSRTLSGDEQLGRTLHRAKDVAREMAAALEEGELGRCAELMNEQWEIKRARAAGSITERLDELREVALGAGARGAVLIGAGGGGFLLAYGEDPERTRAALEAEGAPELPFSLDNRGCVGMV
jgi:D-glycero-alpha-D-manno-heptose-7-phosphate kinase